MFIQILWAWESRSLKSFSLITLQTGLKNYNAWPLYIHSYVRYFLNNDIKKAFVSWSSRAKFPPTSPAKTICYHYVKLGWLQTAKQQLSSQFGFRLTTTATSAQLCMPAHELVIHWTSYVLIFLVPSIKTTWLVRTYLCSCKTSNLFEYAAMYCLQAIKRKVTAK